MQGINKNGMKDKTKEEETHFYFRGTEPRGQEYIKIYTNCTDNINHPI